MSRCWAAFVAVALAGFALAPAPARADGGPVIVIPSRPGVPVIINGRDASYAVVEGDWGLSRPGAVPVTVIGGSPVLPNSVYTPAQLLSSEIRSRAPARPQRDRARGRSRAARSGGEFLALVVDVVRYVAPATITDPATFPSNGVNGALINNNSNNRNSGNTNTNSNNSQSTNYSNSTISNNNTNSNNTSTNTTRTTSSTHER